DLDSSPLNGKLRSFCERVREVGHRGEWSDTYCIDKSTSSLLNQSYTFRYKWY
ncbi:hypothetical protein J3R83DRAFT_10163, partial [Lanmaoa asiatica]